MNCRSCGSKETENFIDLINSPASNSFLKKEELLEPETYYPLKILVCSECLLVQIDEFKKSEDIFSEDYVYFSSFSKSWLKHASDYVDMIVDKLKLDESSFVCEIASNDGYLLRNFVDKKISCLGVEPTQGTAEAAKKVGVESLVRFFGQDTAKYIVENHKKPNLILGNNVLAHVPDLNDFVGGLKTCLAENGVATFEFPHLYQMIELNQFDTIYHEHFSYFSFHAVSKVFERHGMELFDVEELPTHGGSLRIYAKHKECDVHQTSPRVSALVEKEKSAGMLTQEYYEGYSEKVEKVKIDFLNFLLKQKEQGKKVCGFGAAAKGNTLLNYCGVKSDLIDFVVDSSPHKQNLFLPGSHIPVLSPDVIKIEKPDYIIFFPWNLKDELAEVNAYARDWGAKFVVPIPNTEVF